MKRSLRQNLCVLAALLLGTSLLVTDYVDARGGGGGGSRGGGGGSRGGGGASPRVNRCSDLQNRGNFRDGTNWYCHCFKSQKFWYEDYLH